VSEALLLERPASTTGADGSLGTARKSADVLQYIGCNVIAVSGGSGSSTVSATCYARDAAGVCTLFNVGKYSSYEPK
jgi:hypothetical protein